MSVLAVWIYAVLTLIQTLRGVVQKSTGLDICRINSYSNFLGIIFAITIVWIYVVLTLIQTLARNSSNPASLDICRINSYSNCCRLESDVGKIWIYAVLTLIQTQLLNTIRGVWIYAVLTLIQTGRWSRRHACSLDICRINSYSNFFLVRPLFQRLDICRINSYSNSHHSLAVLTVFGYMPY